MDDSNTISKTGFIYSLNLTDHPIKKEGIFTRELYFFALEYIALKVSHSVYTQKRLEQYRQALQIEDGYYEASLQWKEMLAEVSVGGIRYRMNLSGIMLLMNDLYLVLSTEVQVRFAVRTLEGFLSATDYMQRSNQKIGSVFEHWLSTLYIPERSIKLGIEPMTTQAIRNRELTSKVEKRIIITATMSAGKSTLINALVGKRVTRTAAAACTGNISYLFNKPFEDGKIHMYYDELSLDVSQDELLRDEWKNPRMIATYFRTSMNVNKRICLIDTPGVNAYTHDDHAEITYRALLNETYDTCVCVLSARALGTEDEWRHLQWLRAHIPHEKKMVFVVNMLDLFDPEEDDIAEALDDVRHNLKKLGYVSPIICPISARCAYYSKIVQYDKSITKWDKIEYQRMVNQFIYFEYDLSRYYDESIENHTDIEELNLRQKCGFEGFERILFGG